jgi:hypothetical protein
MNPLQLLAVALIALPLTVFAHHGWSEYDATQTLKLTGTIERSTYEHPHGSVTLKTPTKTWIVVLAPPSRMDMRGLARDLLKVGATASVGYELKQPEDARRAHHDRGQDRELR